MFQLTESGYSVNLAVVSMVGFACIRSLGNFLIYSCQPRAVTLTPADRLAVLLHDSTLSFNYPFLLLFSRRHLSPLSVPVLPCSRVLVPLFLNSFPFCLCPTRFRVLGMGNYSFHKKEGIVRKVSRSKFRKTLAR